MYSVHMLHLETCTVCVLRTITQHISMVKPF
uniref:Uncharacterized protein n=1 Tax=Arundo donax TaxID=35708 RepID=A0A0A9BNE3_ARUDO